MPTSKFFPIALALLLTACTTTQINRQSSITLPENFQHTGQVDSASAVVFHAGTVLEGEQIRTSGGRVLCVTALADSIKLAQARAYDLARGIHFDGAQYRRDIGWRAIKTNRP